jgi:class 3 adenylate cyclase
MGDGMLVYFGYPRAHEDDAERAVRAGWSPSTLSAASMSSPPSCKAASGSPPGVVVVGDLIGEGSAQQQSVVGETPNLAARLEALAEPDAVVILRARAGWSAISSNTATSAPSRSRASPGRCRPGRDCARVLSRAGSRRSADQR